MSGIGVSMLTALMLILAFHPYDVWFLAFFSLVPMLIAQHRILPRKWSGLAPAVGIGGWLFVFLTSMFGGNSAAYVIQIVVVVIIIVQVFTVPGVRRFHEQTGYRWFLLQGIADWVGFEMVRSFIPPINTHAFIAQTMYSQPWMLQPISILSIYGLGIVLMLVNFALAQCALVLFDGKFLDVYGKNHPTSPGEPRIITASVYPVYNTNLGQLATIICNDVHWTNTSRRLALKGAQLIAVPTLETPGCSRTSCSKCAASC